MSFSEKTAKSYGGTSGCRDVPAGVLRKGVTGEDK